MKRVAAPIMLLLCLSGPWVQTTETSGQQTTTPDIWTELKDLRDMVHGLRSQVEQLEKDKADQKNKVMVLRLEMNYMVMEVNAQKKRVEDLERRMGEVKVAFFAGRTTGDVGPFNTETTLIYNAVHVNAGSAYNKTTGIFTAPVGGVYYFRFTAFDHRISQSTCVNLYHNDKRLMYNYEHNDDGGHISISNAILVEMNKGDVVYLRLPKGCGIYSHVNNNESTFSGFLLFPLPLV